MRSPRDWESYVTAEQVATDLEDIARQIRDTALTKPLVKAIVTVRFWNPSWGTMKRLSKERGPRSAAGKDGA